MVTFMCGYCDATLKKNQTEKHAFGRCRPASFICIDCHKTFQGEQYKAHISCLTEFQKHWGEYAKPKQKQQPAKNEGQIDLKAKVNDQKKEVIADKKIVEKKAVKQVVKAEENGDEENEGSEWKGWKNEIKKAVKESKNKILLEDLQTITLKRFKQFGNEEDLKDEDIKQLFQEKLHKIKKIKLVSYVVME